jgi:membrane fusion protein (multidrug efflux system)
MSRTFPILLTTAALFACGGGDDPGGGVAAGAAPKKAPSTTAVRVEAATVSATQPVVRLVRPGEVRGAREAQLAAAQGGFVESVLVSSGDKVKKGQAIAYVDTSVYNAQAKLTKVELDDAERELARLEQLGKAVASARVDAARTRVARAKAQHALSRTRQARAVIRAPFAGAVVDLDIERGEVAPPGAPIARVLQLDPVHVFVSVTDRDVVALSEGGSARVLAAGVAEGRKGTIYKIEPAADLRTRTFMVEVEVANPDRMLLPGMMARVAFENTRDRDAILIPQDFLVTRLDGNGVFVVTPESTAEWRPVTLGSIVGTQVEITDGIAAGDHVVSLGQRGLTHGDRIIVTREGLCCTDGHVTHPKSASAEPVEPTE